MKFIIKENTRKDFGFLFDYLIAKHFVRGYFSDESCYENCCEIIKKYSMEAFVSLETLFYNDHFLKSSNYRDLIKNLVQGIEYIPMNNICWEINGENIESNFLRDNVFEHPDLPYYYIIHTNHYGSFCLVNKTTGKYFPYKMWAVLPSSHKNIINGRFDHSKFKEETYFRLTFDGIESNEKIKEIKSLIVIPTDYQTSIQLYISSPIIPKGTNVQHTIITLEDTADIAFRNNLIDLIKSKELELPF